MRLILVFLLVLICACGEAQPIADYHEARQVFWQSLYPGKGKTLYCRQAFDGDFHKGINIEHVFPMSWVTKPLGCGTRKQCRRKSRQFNQIEADLHNLFPAKTHINAERGSFSFAELKGEPREFGKSCDFEVDYRRRLVEPTPEVRGDIARAMFYMAHRYQQLGLRIFAKPARQLLDWHHADPPSEQEKKRNDIIEKLQGNRNLFIDNPKELDDFVQKKGLLKR